MDASALLVNNHGLSADITNKLHAMGLPSVPRVACAFDDGTSLLRLWLFHRRQPSLLFWRHVKLEPQLTEISWLVHCSQMGAVKPSLNPVLQRRSL